MAGFEQEFCELESYVRAAEGLRVTRTSLSVPRAARPEFYGRVERVQRALADEVLGGEGGAFGCMEREAAGVFDGVPAGGRPHAQAGVDGSCDRVRVGAGDLVRVAGACAQVCQALCEQAGLAQFKLASMLEALMADPAREAARPLFSCVLDALQQELGADELKARAARVLIPHAELLWRNTYEAWAYYGVVARLEPVRFHAVFTPDMRQVRTVPTERVEVAVQASSPTLRLPEAVFETAGGRVFAMKSEAAHELDFYGFKNKRRRDSSSGGNTADLVTHRVLLLWELPGVDAVDFVADRDKSRVTPPALTVEVLMPADLATPAYASAFVERINAVRSRRPVQVVAPFGAVLPDGMADDPTVAPVRLHLPGEGARFSPALLDDIASVLGA